MTRSGARALILPALLAAAVAGPAEAGTYTCSTVARRGTAAAGGGLFANRFAEPAVNLAGDVLFLGKTAGGVRTVYLYPNAGGASVVAAQNAVAPGGGQFRKFTEPTINDDGDLAFRARLYQGADGVYVRESGGSLVKAAATTDPAPGGGLFDTFPALSRVSAAGDVAFIARVSGGAGGIFLYDASAASVVAVAHVGDPTGDGRQFCTFESVDLGDSGDVVLGALTKVDCNDTLEVELGSVHQQSGGGFVTVAQEGQSTPILVGTTYARFFDVHANAADKVAFRAATAGTANVVAVFLYDGAGPSTVGLVATGEPAPGTGGALKTIPRMAVTDDDRTIFRGHVLSGTARHGIFVFDDGLGGEDAVLETDPVPTDLYGIGAIYKNIEEVMGADRSGTRVAFTAKARDTTAPRSKSGLFLCTAP